MNDTLSHIMQSGISFTEERQDWAPGDEIAYRVRYLGKEIGYVERDWLRTVEDELRTAGWRYIGDDGRRATGRTRKDAVLNAHRNDQP